MNDRATLFRAYLDEHDQHAWRAALAALLPRIHEVDRHATEIWFHFHPLVIARALASAEGDPNTRDLVLRRLWLQGQPDLHARVDTSHVFLYGHRYWDHVVKTIDEFVGSGAAPKSLELAGLIDELAQRVAASARVDAALTRGITAVGLMTLQQVGPDSFMSAGRLALTPAERALTPEQVLARRTRKPGQGLLGFLKGNRRDHRVVWDERDPDAWFRIIETQHVTTAAAYDTRDHRTRDARCHEGPIPVHCRSGSCGTCWMGVLAGHDQLSPVDAREKQRLREFGYLDTDEAQPIIRLSCMAQALGSVSIVLPAFNGIFGKFRRAQEQTAAPAGTGQAGAGQPETAQSETGQSETGQPETGRAGSGSGPAASGGGPNAAADSESSAT